MSKVWKGIAIVTGIAGIILCLACIKDMNRDGVIISLAILFGYPLIALSIGVLFDKVERTNRELQIMNRNLGELVALYKKNTKAESPKADNNIMDINAADIAKSRSNSGMVSDGNNITDHHDGTKERMRPMTEDDSIICPNCKTKQPADRNVCWECGYKFSK